MVARQFAISSVDMELPLLGRQTLPLADKPIQESLVTVLIGRNGSGKSSLLREIAMAMRQYFSGKPLRSRQGLHRVATIDIMDEYRQFRLNLKANVQEFKTERSRVGDLTEGPSKLIALSFTPFDKFPHTDDSRGKAYAFDHNPFYTYLGFHSDLGASPRSRLLRSIDQLAFARSGDASDERVAKTFEAIGYRPSIELIYEIDDDKYRELPDAWFIDELVRVYQQDRRTGPLSERSRRFSYIIDFQGRLSEGSVPIGYETVRGLLAAKVIRLRSANLMREEGTIVELLELSSGELNLLSGFLGLAAFLDDGCLVLIDEPENSLHPEWQLRYVEMLEAVVRQHGGCHYIVATHSPLIVSGVTGRSARVLRLDELPLSVMPGAVANASPDETLLQAFHIVTANNNFLRHLVLEAMTFIETGRQGEERAVQIATFLRNLYGKIDDKEPLKELIESTVRAILQS